MQHDCEPSLELVVRDRSTGADGVVVLWLQSATGEDLPEWEPGAHIDLEIYPGTFRQYSLCGDPDDASIWRVGVLREPNGRGGSAFVHERLVPGTRVGSRGPRNHFALEPAAAYLFVAGGIGVTPLIPMARRAEADGVPWTFHYGGRSRSSMAFLTELAEYGDRVRVHPQDREGLLDLRTIMGAAPADAVVYCCGPAPLIDAAEIVAAEYGLPLRVERFTPKEVGPPVLDGSFEVHLAQTGVTLTVPPDRSVLDVVEEAGVFVITSCREGTCGSCETPVLEGQPDHRDSLLSPDVTDAMMICVSRAACPRLVLDL